jgi:hypothetical protein
MYTYRVLIFFLKIKYCSSGAIFHITNAWETVDELLPNAVHKQEVPESRGIALGKNERMGEKN